MIIGLGDAYSIRAQQVSKNGILGEIITGVNYQKGELTPKSCVLYQNYPNPFNSSTKISFFVSHTQQVTLKLYDVLGHEILCLFDGKEIAGSHSMVLNADALPSGLYLLYMRTQHSPPQAKKLLLIR